MTPLPDALGRLQAALQRVEGLTEKAKPGPWFYDIEHSDLISDNVDLAAEARVAHLQSYRKPDAVFIAAARSLVPALAVAVKAVLDIHKPDPRIDGCKWCSRFPHPANPCPTIAAIADALLAAVEGLEAAVGGGGE